MVKTDKYEKHACDFKNEDDCEEELEEEGEELEDVEVDHFEEKEDVKTDKEVIE